MPLRSFFVITLICLSAAHVADAQQQKAKLIRVTYPVAELVTPIPGRAGAENHDRLVQSLMDVVTNTVAPATWRDAGGQGSAQYFPLGQAIVVNQTAEVHTEVARLLEQLHKAVKTPGKDNTHQGGAEEQAIPAKRMMDAKERAIEYRLRQPISLQFKDVPFEDAIKELATISGIAIVLDMRALKEARVDLKWPVSCSVEHVEMKFALNKLLSEARLEYMIEDHVLKITTERRLGRLSRITYPIGDLIEPGERIVGETPAKSNDRLHDVLKSIITNTIATNSWEEKGGPASIQYFPMSKSFVISQSQNNHEEIQLLLATLRKLHDLSVTFDVQFVQAPNDAAKNWRQRMAEIGHSKTQSHVMLDQRDRDSLLDNGKRSKCIVVQIPQLRASNGDAVPIELSQKKTSYAEFRTMTGDFAMIKSTVAEWREYKYPTDMTRVLSKTDAVLNCWNCLVTPLVSADRRSIRLDLNVEHTDLDEDQSARRSVKASKVFDVANGRTLLWDLGSVREDKHLFMLITPRVVTREGEPELYLGTLPTIPGR
jgi:hypothetical protein